MQYAGLIIAPVAVLFMAYALLMYKKRTVQVTAMCKMTRACLIDEFFLASRPRSFELATFNMLVCTLRQA